MECGRTFSVEPSDLKRFCSRSCSATVTNLARGPQKEETKKKIAASLKGTPNPYKGVIKVPRKVLICKNPKCRKQFLAEPWRERQYCSTACAIRTVGSRPTSPRAARGKAGIRKDISSKIYFYSRWEANMARLYTHLGIKWKFTPKTFDIGGQMYTPDFYLPATDEYVEVKNFLGAYSKSRDEKFRKKFPHIKLHLLLKDEYKDLERKYSGQIPRWEFGNRR